MAASKSQTGTPKKTASATGGGFSFCQNLKTKKGPFIIGVAGGTASGKSSVCQRIVEEIKRDSATNVNSITCISMDYFYRDLQSDESEKAKKGDFNFDHPDAFDIELITKTLSDICERKTVKVPKYDYRENAKIPDEFTVLEPTDVVLIEGILTFYWPELRDKYQMKLFVDTDADTRLARRVKRDIRERGRTLDTILNQYINTVKPAFEEFCLPTKKFADVIIPRGADNTVAIDLIVQSVKDILANESRGSSSSAERSGIDTTPPSNPPLVKRGSDSKISRLH